MFCNHLFFLFESVLPLEHTLFFTPSQSIYFFNEITVVKSSPSEIPIFVRMSIRLFVFLFVSLSVSFIFLFDCMFITLSVYLYVWLVVCMLICFSFVCLFVRLTVCLCICMFVCLFSSLSVCSLDFTLVFLFVRLLVSSFVCLFDCLPVVIPKLLWAPLEVGTKKIERIKKLVDSIFTIIFIFIHNLIEQNCSFLIVNCLRFTLNFWFEQIPLRIRILLIRCNQVVPN